MTKEAKTIMGRWIGPVDNSSGSYHATICEELTKRTRGYPNAKPLYCFENGLGGCYMITGSHVIKEIETFLS